MFDLLLVLLSRSVQGILTFKFSMKNSVFGNLVISILKLEPAFRFGGESRSL
jgi:hypothetical protein